MIRKAIVLDANVLIRAALGRQVRNLILEHAETIRFFAPDVAYTDARKYLPVILKKRNVDPATLLSVLDHLETVVQPLNLNCTKSKKSKPVNASPDAILTIGPFWQAPWLWAAQSGRKIRIFLVLVLRSGPADWSISILNSRRPNSRLFLT